MGKKKKDEPDDRGPTSLFLFTPTSPVRKLMTWLVRELEKGTWKKEIWKGCSQWRKLNCCQQPEEVETSIKSLKLPLTFWQEAKHQFGFRKD